MMQQRRIAVQHAERMADKHVPAWRHMALVAKQMHHWPEQPTGAEMDQLVDAYAGQYTQSQLENDAMPAQTQVSKSNKRFNSASSHPSSLEPENVDARSSYPVESQKSSNSNKAKADFEDLQSMLHQFTLDRENMLTPAAKMHHSHTPYQSARTQGLFSSGHVRESDSLTELKLTILNLENRLEVIKANSAFDIKNPEVAQALLLVKQSEMP